MVRSKSILRIYVEETGFRARVWYNLYQYKSVLLHVFGCSQIWCMVHQLLENRSQEQFTTFRTSQASESAAVAVAVC